MIVDTQYMTTGTSETVATATGGVEATPDAGGTATGPVNPPVAASPSASTKVIDSEEQAAGLPPIPEDVGLEILSPVAEDASVGGGMPIMQDVPGVGVMTAVDAEAAAEIAQAINSGIIQREATPAVFLPLRDRWVWTSVAIAAFVSAVLIAEGPASARGTGPYVWWLVGTSLGSFPVAFGVGLGAAWLARLARVRSVGGLRLSFALGSIGLFLGLALVVEHYVNIYNRPEPVAVAPRAKPRKVIVAEDPSAAVHAPVTQEKAVDTVRERNERQVSVIATTMKDLVEELDAELEEKQRRAGKDPVKALLSTNNFANSKNFNEARKRIEALKRISEDYEQRVMARYDHFPPRLRALELPNEAKKQLVQAYERSRASGVSKLREMMMYDRAVLSELRELYAFIQSRVGKFTVSNQVWFRDPKDAAVYNGLVKRVNDLSQQQQRASQQLHQVVFAKLTEIGKDVQWASLD